MKTSTVAKRVDVRTSRRKKEESLSATARKSLAEVLAAEIAGAPVDAQVYRARLARRIPILDQLVHQHMLERDGLKYVVTFWGLFNTPGRQAQAAQRHCKAVFKVLVKHYRVKPNTVLRNAVLEEMSHLTASQAAQAVRLLNRGPANVGTCTDPENLGVMPSERHLTLRTFERARNEAREIFSRPRNYFPPSHSILSDVGNAIASSSLNACESQEVRDSWLKATKRVSSDFDGAITSARTLVESVCRYVLEEFAIPLPVRADLGQLYKAAAKELQLDSSSHSHPVLRQILGNCSGAVSGLAELRNALSDAHGKGTRGLKPARRHAELAVLLAGAISGFLLASLDAQRPP